MDYNNGSVMPKKTFTFTFTFPLTFPFLSFDYINERHVRVIMCVIMLALDWHYEIESLKSFQPPKSIILLKEAVKTT